MEIDGITYTEVIGSHKGSFGQDSAEVSRTFDVSWGKMFHFIQAMLGDAVGRLSSQEVKRSQRYRGTCLYAKRASFEGIGALSYDGNGEACYPTARVTISYVPVPNGDPANDTWFEESTSFKSEQLILPSHSLKFKGTTEKIPEATGLTISTADISLTVYNIDAYPTGVQIGTLTGSYFNRSAIIAACGKINSDVFMGYPAGTLKLEGFSPRRTVSLFGMSSKYTVTYGLKFKANKWNFFWRPGHGWTEVVKNSSDEPLYDSTPFRSLILNY